MQDFEYREGKLEFLYGKAVTIEGGAIFYCKTGTAKMILESSVYDIAEGTVTFLLPGMALALRVVSEDFDGTLWTFNQQMFERLNNRFSPTFYHVVVANPVFCHKEGSDDTEFVRLSLEMAKLVVSKPQTPHSERRLFNMVENLVTFIADWAVPSDIQEQGEGTCDRKRMLYRQFIMDVCHYSKTEHYIDFYCNRLCISRRYLSQIVRECNSRYTPQLIIIEHLNFKIKRALISTDKTVTQIADEFKFQNQSNLSSFFIRNNNMSPTEFRNKSRNGNV